MLACLRLLLAIVTRLDLEIFQMDVKTIFLNGQLDKKVYMKQRIGFEAQDNEQKQIMMTYK